MEGGKRDLAELPKAHLHIHLFGSVRRSTVRELADRQGYPKDAVDGVLRAIDGVNSMASFQVQSSFIQGLITTPEDVERICREFVADEADAGVVHSEPSFVPHDLARLFGMTADELFARMDKAFQAEAAKYGMTVRYVISPNRGRDADYLLEAARFAVRQKPNGVVAFGYGGDETLGHARMHEAVAIALEGGLWIDPHAGETVGPESVAEALEVSHPTRLAHGATVVRDPVLTSHLARLRIPCNVSLGSNARLGVVPNVSAHMLPEMLDAGLMATLNADDTTFFSESVLAEFVLARDVLHIDDHRLADMARNSVNAASMPEPERKRALAGIDAWERGPQAPERELS